MTRLSLFLPLIYFKAVEITDISAVKIHVLLSKRLEKVEKGVAIANATLSPSFEPSEKIGQNIEKLFTQYW